MATITGTLAVVFNTVNHAVTEFIGLDFNSMVQYKGRLIGSNSSGVYEVTGSLDNGTTPIYSVEKSGDIDFYAGDRPTIRRPRDGHIYHTCVGVVDNGGIVYTIQGDETGDSQEIVCEAVGAVPTRRRVKFARGLKNKAYSLKIENINGSVFNIYDTQIDVENNYRDAK